VIAIDELNSVYATDQGPLDLLVVIVNYKVEHLVVDCLRSLATQVRDIPRMRVAVCENGTGEHAIDFLRNEIIRNAWSDWVILKAITPNVGFTGGNNAILRDALGVPEPPRYFLLLNADTIVHPGALQAMYQAMEDSSKIGIAAPTLIDAQGQRQHTEFLDFSPLSELLRSASTGPLNRVFGRCAFPLEPLRGRPDIWLSFACAMIRREVLLQVGVLDEGFFLYFDDADFSRTVRNAGWKLKCVPSAEVVHLEGQTTGVPELARLRDRKPHYYYVSRARYFAKHRGLTGLWSANVAWHIGRCISKMRELFEGKLSATCQREWLDNWTNGLAPLRKSTPQPPPITHRFVVPAGRTL